jgi:hypothetical protein
MWTEVENKFDSNFFFDEVPNTVEPEVLNLLSTKVSNGKFLWIACKSNLPPSKSSLESMLNSMFLKMKIKDNRDFVKEDKFEV